MPLSITEFFRNAARLVRREPPTQGRRHAGYEKISHTDDELLGFPDDHHSPATERSSPEVDRGKAQSRWFCKIQDLKKRAQKEKEKHRAAREAREAERREREAAQYERERRMMCTGRRRRRSRSENFVISPSPRTKSCAGQGLYVPGPPGGPAYVVSDFVQAQLQAIGYRKAQMEREESLRKEWDRVDRERESLEREREDLDREREDLDREREDLDRERMEMERVGGERGERQGSEWETPPVYEAEPRWKRVHRLVHAGRRLTL